MLRRAIELGVTYYDSAAIYNSGDSERVIGEALSDARDKIVISTKNHYKGADKAAWWKNLTNSLEFLRTDHIDIYKFHDLTLKHFEEFVACPGGLLEDMRKAKEQGMIRHICVSSHDAPENIIKLLDTDVFDVLTIQYNLLDRRNEPVIKHAAAKDIGVVIMGPVAGGRLGEPSEQIAGLLPAQAKSTAALAIRFVMSNPGVGVCLSGMTKIEEVEENVRIADVSEGLTPEENSRIAEAFEERKKLAGLYCTGCNYCLPCPEGVNIPEVFTAMHYETVYGLRELARRKYNSVSMPATRCIACGKCEQKCPQKLGIPEQLRKAMMRLDPNAGAFIARYSPDRALEVEGTQVTVGFTGYVFNVSDKDRDIEMKIAAGGGASVNPDVIRVGEVKAFRRKRFGFSADILWDDTGILQLVTNNGIGDLQTRHAVVPVIKSADYELQALREEPPHTFGVGMGENANLAWGDKALIPAHGANFWLSTDGENLFVYMIVKEDAAVMAQEPFTQSAQANSMCVFLDGRREPDLHKPAYEQGVLMLQLFPMGNDGRLANVVSRSGEPQSFETVSARKGEGYCIDLKVPFAAFCPGGAAPEHFGFDVCQMSFNAERALNLATVWAGNRNNRENASGFGDALLIPE